MITIKELYEMCKQQIAKGNGNLKIFISDDEEGNGYHGLYYGLEAFKTMDTANRKAIIKLIYEEDLSKTYKDYAILG